MNWDRLWINANIATMTGDSYGIIEAGAVAVKDGKGKFGYLAVLVLVGLYIGCLEEIVVITKHQNEHERRVN